MGETPGSPTVSMKLQRIAQQAQRYPQMVFNNVFHLIDREFLREAYRLTRKNSAPGVDQGTATQYACGTCMSGCATIGMSPRPSSGYGARKKVGRRGP